MTAKATAEQRKIGPPLYAGADGVVSSFGETDYVKVFPPRNTIGHARKSLEPKRHRVMPARPKWRWSRRDATRDEQSARRSWAILRLLFFAIIAN